MMVIRRAVRAISAGLKIGFLEQIEDTRGKVVLVVDAVGIEAAPMDLRKGPEQAALHGEIARIQNELLIGLNLPLPRDATETMAEKVERSRRDRSHKSYRRASAQQYQFR